MALMLNLVAMGAGNKEFLENWLLNPPVVDWCVVKVRQCDRPAEIYGFHWQTNGYLIISGDRIEQVQNPDDKRFTQAWGCYNGSRWTSHSMSSDPKTSPWQIVRYDLQENTNAILYASLNEDIVLRAAKLGVYGSAVITRTNAGLAYKSVRYLGKAEVIDTHGPAATNIAVSELRDAWRLKDDMKTTPPFKAFITNMVGLEYSGSNPYPSRIRVYHAQFKGCGNGVPGVPYDLEILSMKTSSSLAPEEYFDATSWTGGNGSVAPFQYIKKDKESLYKTRKGEWKKVVPIKDPRFTQEKRRWLYLSFAVVSLVALAWFLVKSKSK